MTDDSFATDLGAAMDSGGAATTPDPVAVSTPVVDGDAATTAPPVDVEAIFTGDTSKAAKAPGPIPFDAHKTALDNARTKALAEYKEKYGWAEQVDQAAVKRAVEIAQQSTQDPIGFLTSYLKDLQQHPVYSAHLQQLARQALEHQRAGVTEEPKADLEYQMPNGQTVALYSAGQQAKREAWLQQQILQQAQQSIAPVFQTVQTLQQQAATAQHQAEVAHFVDAKSKEVLTWAGMDDPDNRKAVADALQAAQIDPNDDVQVSLATEAAWRQIVVPKLLSGSRQAVLHDIHQQATAGRTVQPGQASTKPAKSMEDMTTAEALRYAATQLAGA